MNAVLGRKIRHSVAAQCWPWGLLTLGLDALVTLLLIGTDFSIALAHSCGFAAGSAVALFVRLSSRCDNESQRVVAPAGLARALLWVVYAFLLLALRGGVIGSLIVWGTSEPVAVVAGVAVGWALFYAFLVYSDRARSASDAGAAYWSFTALAMIACALVLRLSYLGVLEATPQEAYYWNYSIRLAPGYFDHPPMVALLIHLGERLFGHSELGLRIGAFVSALAVPGFVYAFASRLVDRSSALVAAALAVVLPYYFFGAGLLVTPDAPLTVAWAMSLYFLHRALVGAERWAWFGVGVGMGLGMLSKYSIALLGPSALLFVLLDRQARRWLVRPEPYLAILVALVIFSPVIYWNATHDWASFRFQTQGRFSDIPQFSLHILLQNIVAMVTPLPLIVLPLLFAKVWRNAERDHVTLNQEQYRNRMFVTCLVVFPLLVFAWNSLTQEPRTNWTGPLWLALLPGIGWAVVHVAELRWSWLRAVLRKTTLPLLLGLLVLYAVTLHYLTLGIPGVGYPKGVARLLGWPQAARQLAQVQQDVIREGNPPPVIVGLDTYFIASKLSFYGTTEYLVDTNNEVEAGARAAAQALHTSGRHLLGDRGLMFRYWDPPESLRGRPMILVARSLNDLDDAALSRFFAGLGSERKTLPLIKNSFGDGPKRVSDYYYRLAYDYRPPTEQ